MRRVVTMAIAGLVLFGLFLAMILAVIWFMAGRGLRDDTTFDADFSRSVEWDGDDGAPDEILLLADVGDRCIGVAGDGFENVTCGDGGLVEGRLLVFERSMAVRLAVVGSDASLTPVDDCDQEWVEILNGFEATWCVTG